MKCRDGRGLRRGQADRTAVAEAPVAIDHELINTGGLVPGRYHRDGRVRMKMAGAGPAIGIARRCLGLQPDGVVNAIGLFIHLDHRQRRLYPDRYLLGSNNDAAFLRDGLERNGFYPRCTIIYHMRPGRKGRLNTRPRPK